MRDEAPVLVGAGQFTYRGDGSASPSPLMMIKIAAERAAADAGEGGPAKFRAGGPSESRLARTNLPRRRRAAPPMMSALGCGCVK